MLQRLRLLLRRLSPKARRRERGIAARADLVKLEALAEGAYDAMYGARGPAAKDHYDTARLLMRQAMDAARKAGLFSEARRLKVRLDHIEKVYNSQFRGVG